MKTSTETPSANKYIVTIKKNIWYFRTSWGFNMEYFKRMTCEEELKGRERRKNEVDDTWNCQPNEGERERESR